MKNLKKFVKKNAVTLTVIPLALLLVLGAFGFVKAQLVPQTVVIENVEHLVMNVAGGLGEMAFGAITQDKSTFNHGIEILSNGLDVTGAADFNSAVNIDGDTTISNPDATYQFALDFTQATTTSGVAAQATQLLLGTQVISGNMLCNMVAADLTATGIFGYDLRMGTSTTATSSDAHLIADTAVTTSTDDILNKEDDEGTSTDEVWSVTDGLYFAVMMTFDTANATSSASFTTAGGNAGAGTVHVNCWNSD